MYTRIHVINRLKSSTRPQFDRLVKVHLMHGILCTLPEDAFLNRLSQLPLQFFTPFFAGHNDFNMLLANLTLAVLTIGGTIVSWIISASFYFHYYTAKFFESPPKNGSEYDYIVVGSGSSGSVVAGRLAEAGYQILLVEAGGPSHILQASIFSLTFCTWWTLNSLWPHRKYHQWWPSS